MRCLHNENVWTPRRPAETAAGNKFAYLGGGKEEESENCIKFVFFIQAKWAKAIAKRSEKREKSDDEQEMHFKALGD